MDKVVPVQVREVLLLTLALVLCWIGYCLQDPSPPTWLANGGHEGAEGTSATRLVLPAFCPSVPSEQGQFQNTSLSVNRA